MNEILKFPKTEISARPTKPYPLRAQGILPLPEVSPKPGPLIPDFCSSSLACLSQPGRNAFSGTSLTQ
jgi:hypothetical protein